MQKIRVSNLSLEQLYDSGQIFRWNRIDNDRYLLVSRDLSTEALQKGNDLYLFCSDRHIPFWSSYLDLDTNYEDIIQCGRGFHDDFLDEAMKYGSGIRILKQDLWEASLTFIISQNNNIPRIRSIINKLCALCGHFPDTADILSMDLSTAGLGYRDKYIKDAALKWPLSSDDSFCTICGIGKKVNSCIRLYGCHDLSSAPIDTWMKKIIHDEYNGSRPDWMHSTYAGVFQQYVFFYKRSLNSLITSGSLS